MATQLRFDVTALDQASRTFTRMGQAVERFEKRLDRLDGKRVDAEVDVDTKKAEQQVGAFARNIRREIEAAVKALPDIDLDADASEAQREITRIRSELAALADQRIGIDIDAATAHAEMTRLHSELERLGRESTDLQVRADTAAAAAALKLVDSEVDRLDGRTAKVKVDVDRSLSDTLIHVTRLGGALAALSLPAGLTLAAPQIAALGSAALTASGGLLLIPAAGVAGAAGIGTLVLAFRDFGDAVSDDPKKAAEALAKLAPEARETATAVREIAPAWREVQQATQDALFKDLAADLKRISAAELPAVKAATTQVAAGFNAATHDVAAFLVQGSAVRDVRTVLDNVAAAAKNAAGAAAPLTAAFVDLAEVGSSRLPALGHDIEVAAQHFADFIDTARESGQLGEWIDRGVASLGKLVSISGNVGTTLTGIFRASDEAGADFLDTVDRITEGISEFVNSAQGQEAITSLFREISSAVDAAGPGIDNLATKFGEFIVAADRADVLQNAGEAVGAIASSAGDVLGALTPLLPVLSGILDVATDMAPILVPVAAGFGALKIAESVVGGISNLSGGLLTLGGRAKDADGKVGGVSGKIAGLQAVVLKGLAAVALVEALAEIQKATEGADGGIGDLTDSLQDLADGIGQLASSPTSVFAEIGAEWDKMIRHVSGTSELPPVTINFQGEWGEVQAGYKKIVDEANATGVTIEINGNTTRLGDAYNRVLEQIRQGKAEIEIDGKTVPVEEAIALIKAKTESDDLTVTVNGQTMPLDEAIEKAHAQAVGKAPWEIPVGADTSIAETEIRDGVGVAMTAVEQKKIQVQANTAPAEGAVLSYGAFVGSQQAILSVFADTTQGFLAANELIGAVNQGKGTVTINGNPVPAQSVLSTLLTAVSTGQGTININGQDVPARAVLSALLSSVDAGTGTVTMNGQDVPAKTVLSALISAVDQGKGTVTINGQDVPAQQALAALLGRVNSSSGSVTVNANTGPARSALQALVTEWQGRTIYVNIGGNRVTAGGGVFGFDGGGVASFAGGGWRRASARRGMVIPGYAPGIDTEPTLMSKGEAVLVPELVRQLGARRILAANAEASGGRPATVVGNIASIMDGIIGRTQSIAQAGRGPGAVTGAGITRVHVIGQSAAAPAQTVDLRPLLAELRALRPAITTALAQAGLTIEQTVINPVAEPASQAAASAARTLAELGAW